MDWFYDVFGFTEQGMSSIQRNITKDGMFLTCHAKGDTTVQCGRLDVPTLQKLREDTKEFVQKNPTKSFKNRSKIQNYCSSWDILPNT